MKKTKIQFSPAEAELLSNADIILTKNKAMEKIKAILEEVQHLQYDFVSNHSGLSNNELFRVPAKISKGENYLGLPYLILDYPRNFSSQNSFAIRTMFWWGHFFSSTLHLSGEYLHFKNIIEKHTDLLSKSEYYIGVSNDAWQHHFEYTNYRDISSFDKAVLETLLNEMPQIKIAAKWSIGNWESVSENLFESWKRLLTCCGLIT